MANHPSAEKRHRQSERRRVRNRVSRSKIRTAVKRVRASIEAGDAPKAAEQFKVAAPLLQRMGARGLIHKRTAARRISRLAKRVNAAKAGA